MSNVLVIGAGPAGLTAALELARHNVSVTIVESNPHYVGGISQTADYKGYKFDIGGHRFYTKNDSVNQLWKEMLGDDFLYRQRKSRILYEGKFYNYPISLFNALFNLGLFRACNAVISYLRYQIFPIRPEQSYADWMTNRFGKVLFETFFKTYTEKIWGIPVREISKDWAVQRIKTFSLFGAVVSAIFPWKRRKFKTLIDHFYYPKYGPGMMWEAFTERCKRLGVDIRMGSQVVGLTQTESKYTAVIKNGKGSTSELSQFDSVLSTMPLRELIAMLPNVPEEVSQAAQRLKYRDFITALVIINKEKIFDDNWIYIHDPEVRAGRIQNFKNWSEWMVPDSSTTSLGLEYFIFEDEELWNKPDDFFNELARKEVVQLGFCTRDEILDSTILRVKKAYPVYDEEYKRVVEIIAKFLSTIPSVYTAGRNGLHRWNNQDHSMIAGMTAAQEILSSQKTGKIWNINTDSEYGETSVSDREIPKRIFPR